MNDYHVTGWIPAEGSVCVTSAGVEILLFTLVAKDRDTGEDMPLKMRLIGHEAIVRHGPLITRGRACSITAHAKNVPIVRRGVTVAETTAFVVDEIEFHSRAKAETPATVAAAAEQEAQAV